MSLAPYLPLQVSSDFRTGSFGSGWDGAEPGWDAWNLGTGPVSANQDNAFDVFEVVAFGESSPTSLTTDERGSFEARVQVRIYAYVPIAFTVIYHLEETPFEGDPEDGEDITISIGPEEPVIIDVPITLEVYTRMIVTAIIAHPWN